jgi:hypothetical protein
MLCHKTSINEFKIEIISSIFPNYNGMKLEINTGNISEKSQICKRMQQLPKLLVGQRIN